MTIYADQQRPCHDPDPLTPGPVTPQLQRADHRPFFISDTMHFVTFDDVRRCVSKSDLASVSGQWLVSRDSGLTATASLDHLTR